jgi:hypothetical protein
MSDLGTWSGEEKGMRVALVTRSRRVTIEGTTSSGRGEIGPWYGGSPDVLKIGGAVGSSSIACRVVK